MNITEYFQHVRERVEKDYEIANAARAKGLDPEARVEIPIALSLAEKAVGLVSSLYPQLLADDKIVKRILELEKKYRSLDPAVALSIAEEIARERFCKFESHLQAIEAGARVAIAYMTLGVVSSPIEGFVNIHIEKTKNGEEYLSPYYSGPIRSAGGTEAAFSLVIIDYLRETFGYARYDPTEDEVKRGIHESYLYHERITNLQYLPTEGEIEFLMKNLPIQVSGDPSEDKEVFNYKDLARIKTNFIRSGFCLVLNEGMAQKAPKIWKRVEKLREKGFKLSDWDWLGEFVRFQTHVKEGKKQEGAAGAVYIRDLVAGRPVFGHPSHSGAFRLRYGRARNTGYSALAVHPATMCMAGSFIASGTQLKIEKPTKGCAIASCTTIDGPIVRMKNGSVRKISDCEEAKKIYPDVEEIIYLGDLLVPYGDFANRNHVLEKAGYVEQYWLEELKKAGGDVAALMCREHLLPQSPTAVGWERALELSRKYKIPLHPEYIYYWREIFAEQFEALLDWIGHGEIRSGVLVLPYLQADTSRSLDLDGDQEPCRTVGRVLDRERFQKGKRALELIGCEHEVVTENVVLNKKDTRALLFNLGLGGKENLGEEMANVALKMKRMNASGREVLGIISGLCEIEVRDKSGTFIGARMGRPEKAKLRKLTGSPHVLFPVGEEGGRLRSFQAALEIGKVTGDFPLFYCDKCKRETVYGVCEICGGHCKKKEKCPICGEFVQGKCEEHDRHGVGYGEKRIEIRGYFDAARKIAGVRQEEIPIVKGVRGTSSADHSCENLAKGLLRARYNLNVNKDGTIRYDITEMPLTHFKPKEVGTSILKLRELGYEKDVYGAELEDENQVLEIFPHDVILPACPGTLDERADDVFLRVSKFVDDELERIYGLPRFFNAGKAEDLAGCLLGCIAPHNCAAVAGRLIGFSKTQGFLASPYMHAAMRRDCLDYNSYVSVCENGIWRIKKIGDYIENLKPSEKLDGFGTLGKKIEGVGVWSNPGKTEITEITKHTPTSMLRIFLEDGREIKVTENHRLYIKGKKEKRARDLRLGDKLIAGYKREIEERDIEELYLPEIFLGREDIMIKNIRSYLERFEKLTKHDNFVFRDSFPITLVEEILRRHGKTLGDLPSSARIAIKRDNISLPLRVNIDNVFLEVVGLYIAEGYLRKKDGEKGFYQISIAGNGEIKDFVKRVFDSHFGLKPTHENDAQVVFSSRIIYELFGEYLKCGHGAKEKRIPYMFLNLKKEKIAALLRGYFEGDGSVSLSDIRVACDSVSEGLKYDLSFLLSRFGILTKFYEYEKEPGPKVKQFYLGKKRAIPKFRITKIVILSDFVKRFKEIGFLSERKNKILDELCKKNPYGTKIEHDDNYAYPKIVKIEEIGQKESYCFNVKDEHNFFANDILLHNCDGDESAVMLLMDMLINFSRHFLPAHRGGTQDAPLVLNARMKAGEVDDMVFDIDVSREIPLELYEAAERGKSPYEIKMENVKSRLGGDKEFKDIWFSYDTEDINLGPVCSSYKTLPTMGEKVSEQMELCRKIRAVNTSDVARLIIERHFIRDTRGNLRKFSMQGFRCVNCNEKYRRPPLVGKCEKCGGRLIFTISEGSILKYMQPALELARKFEVSPYLLESLELTEMYIQSIFGKEKEIQENISKWF